MENKIVARSMHAVVEASQLSEKRFIKFFDQATSSQSDLMKQGFGSLWGELRSAKKASHSQGEPTTLRQTQAGNGHSRDDHNSPPTPQDQNRLCTLRRRLEAATQAPKRASRAVQEGPSHIAELVPRLEELQAQRKERVKQC